MPTLDRVDQALKAGIPIEPRVTVLSKKSPNTKAKILIRRCPLEMLNTFCPHLTVSKTAYGPSVVITGPEQQAFKDIFLWMDSYCAARKKVLCIYPTEDTYLRLDRLRNAAHALQLDDMEKYYQSEMDKLEAAQLSTATIVKVYKISPPDLLLRKRVAISIAKLLREKLLLDAKYVAQLREEMPAFDADLNLVMDGPSERAAK